MLGLYEVFYAGHLFLRLITAAMVIYCVLSWFRPNFRAFYMLGRFVQPFVSPFQKLSARLMRYFRAPIDFSFLLAVIGYQILQRLWWQLYFVLARRL